MTGSAQREFLDGHESWTQAGRAESLQPELAPTGLRQEAAAKLAAHRRRREQAGASDEYRSQKPDAGHPQPRSRQDKIAAAVKERYAQTPSYRAFLAEQAKRAIEEAAAAAEVARRNAEAVAAVQHELLVELELWDAPQEFSITTADVIAAEPMSEKRDPSTGSGQAMGHTDSLAVSGLRVRLYEDLGAPVAAVVRSDVWQAAPDAAESLAMDAEIAFRKSPVFEDYKAFLAHDREPPVPLPANLLEFPRQLVAARKARPRLAEGPLLEDAPRSAQLRIFEVEPEQISTAPVVASVAAEWANSIRLGEHTVREAVASEATPLLSAMLSPQIAPLGLRAMAGLVDLGLVAVALVAFVAAFAEAAGQVPGGLPGAIALAVTAVAFYLIYQLLFFTLSDQTPGMRYAKIGLCTFTDENPTRGAMRKRVLAQLIAVCPMGLGLLWSLLDEDGLGWHDRISKMYQRAY